MRILVIGAGATGGYFGGRLAQAGRDVTFLVRSDRAEQLRMHGLRIISPNGNATISPQLTIAGAIDSTFDVILLTVKAYALDRAIEDFAPAVGSESMILPVLNGMRHIEVLTERFGTAPVLGGVCVVASTLDDQGQIVQLSDMQELVYGEIDGALSTRIAALDSLMQGAGFKARASQVILQEMWEKWVFLASLGGITCLMRGTIGEIEAAPGGADLARQLLEECSAVATASGHSPRDEFLARTGAALTAPKSGLASSMYRDLQGARPVEAEHILGDLLARARAFGLATPILAAAFANLTVYQNNLHGRTPRAAAKS
jgi:2-dehydropantoate 2-reductase